MFRLQIGRLTCPPCEIRIPLRRPLCICPRCTTPVTPITSSIPSQCVGLPKLSSFSTPQGLHPAPQLPKRHHKQSVPATEGMFLTHLRMFRIMIPSTGGKSTSFPSTSNSISLWRSRLPLFPDRLFTILRRPIFKYTRLLCKLQQGEIYRNTSLEANMTILPAAKFVRVFFPGIVEVQCEIGVQADTKIVVHNKHTGVVLSLATTQHLASGHSFDLSFRLLVWVKDYRPSKGNRKALQHIQFFITRLYSAKQRNSVPIQNKNSDHAFRNTQLISNELLQF